MSPASALGLGLILLLVAGCGNTALGPADVHPPEGTVPVTIGTISLEQAGLETIGVPRDPETGELAVAEAELRVICEGEEVFFDEHGHEVAEAEAEPIVLTRDEPDTRLFLVPGIYTFELVGRDEQGNDLAYGEVSGRLIADAERVSISLASLVEGVSFEAPEVVQANEVFQVGITVHPPGRADLSVPPQDYSIAYSVTGGRLLDEDRPRLRVAAECPEVTVSAQARSNARGDAVRATLTVPVKNCPKEGSEASADLVPPFVNITSPEGGDAVTGDTVTLEGEVSDLQSGVERLEIYDGVAHLGDAEIDDSVVPHDWTFTATGLQARSHLFTAVAVDHAGNTARAEVEVEVGGEDR